MVKITIEFNMDDPDDMIVHKRMMSADKMCSILWDIQSNMRTKYKNFPEGVNEKFIEGYNAAVTEIMERMEDEGVNIDELWN